MNIQQLIANKYGSLHINTQKLLYNYMLSYYNVYSQLSSDEFYSKCDEFLAQHLRRHADSELPEESGLTAKFKRKKH